MSGRRLIAMARKEFLHVFRDARSLALGILIPVVLLALFGYALTLDVDDAPVAVLDRSATGASLDFQAAFSGSPFFRLYKSVDSYGELVREIDSGRALAALVIPEDFARSLARGKTASAQFIIDGSNANTAQIALGYAEALASIYSQKISLEYASRMTGKTIEPPLDVRARAWYNPEMKSQFYIIPGLTAVIMMIIAAMLTSLTVAREWERGTMEQLISTPVRNHELILGKLIPYFAIGFLDLAIAFILGKYVFGVPVRGNPAIVFLLSSVFLVGALSMGITISILTKNQMVASQLSMVTTFLPSYLLSGLMFSIINMPGPLQLFSYVVPARYLIVILRGVYLKGLGLETLLYEALLLAGFAALLLMIAHVKFKRRLD